MKKHSSYHQHFDFFKKEHKKNSGRLAILSLASSFAVIIFGMGMLTGLIVKGPLNYTQEESLGKIVKIDPKSASINISNHYSPEVIKSFAQEQVLASGKYYQDENPSAVVKAQASDAKILAKTRPSEIEVSIPYTVLSDKRIIKYTLVEQDNQLQVKHSSDNKVL